ncbi:hypothetical protein SAMN05444920_102240 [Nonomuraea solani]|uniref:Uncharacterized protein n=1 Tax=Nonomuraea solani TaxID=1144553 RepID=A0A1H5YDA5_9ACTN|nr:hypothetical protein [Nonomuraea solani]SEG22033.1 hypothetical protein SAMN05444920_102240 [Nonomuraea solani]
MNGSVIAAATPRKAYKDQIVLDGIGFRHTMRGPLARYDVMLASLVAIGIVIGLVPVGKKGPGVRPIARHLSFTPLVETVRGLLAGPPSAGPVVMAIAGCAGLSLLGYLWVRAQFTKRA